MKGKWMAAVMMVAMLEACERKTEPAAANPSADSGKQETVAVDGGKYDSGKAEEPEPPKSDESPVLIEKKPPVAEPVPGQPGFVKSPYNGKIIDVKGIPAGRLVADPTYPAEEKKHFRVPEMPEVPDEPARPAPILDPSILINPGGAKERTQRQQEEL